MTKHIKFISLATTLVLVGLVALSVSAYSAPPTGTPPDCPSDNPACHPPINVSGNHQTKPGWLTVAGMQLGKLFFPLNLLGLPTVGQMGGNGDKIILSGGTATAHPYSLGLNTGLLWQSVPAGASYGWYVGGNERMKLTNTTLGVRGTIHSVTGYKSGALTLGSDVEAKVWSPWENALHLSAAPDKDMGTGQIAFSFGGDGATTGRYYFLNSKNFWPAGDGKINLGVQNSRWGTLYTTKADVYSGMKITDGDILIHKGDVRVNSGDLIFSRDQEAGKVSSPWEDALYFSVSPGKEIGTGQMAFSFGGDGAMTGRRYFLTADTFRPSGEGSAILGEPHSRWKTLYALEADVYNGLKITDGDILVSKGRLILNGRLILKDGTQGAGKVLVSDENGVASWQSGYGGGDGLWETIVGTTNIKNKNTGNVGIGVTNPTARLHVNGPAKIQGNNFLEFGAGIAGKEENAGKIVYNGFYSNALDIVGAGTAAGSRLVKLWDNINVPGSVSTTNLCTTAGSCTTVESIINNTGGGGGSLTPGGLGFDVNGDGFVNSSDAQVVNACVLNAASCTNIYRLRSDLNRDEVINAIDVQMINNAVTQLSGSGLWGTITGTNNIENKNSGNVGIGISTPVSKLTVNGNIRGATFQSITGFDTGVLTFGSNVNAKVLAPWIDALHFSVSPGKEIGTGSMAFTFGGDGVMTGRKYFLNATAFRPSASGGATLGIPNAPWGTLYSTGADFSGQVTIRGGNPGANKILTSNATGLATWKSGRLEERYPNFGGYEASGTDCPTILTGINICSTYTTATRGSDYYNISNDRPALGWGGGRLSSPSCGPGFVATGGSADYVGVSFTGAGMSSWPGDYNNWECKMNLTSAVQAGTFKCWARCTKI